MRLSILGLLMLITAVAHAQEEGDTLYRRCPVFVIDTLTSNNFFLESFPANVRVYRVSGDLTIAIEQREQFFTFFFGDKKLKPGTYKISSTPRNKDVVAKYSFRSGEQVSYVNVSNGTIDCSFDKEKDLWFLKVNGMIANMVGRSITYYKVKADFYIK